MQISFVLGVLLTYGSIATAREWVRQPDPQQQSSAGQSSEPCAQLAAIVNPLRAANPKGSSPIAPGQLAFDCLNSVPLHKEEAMGVAGSIIPYARFQSDLAFKKNPPAGYQMKPVDIIGSLTKIVDNLTTDIYPNEYAWQVDTFKVFASAKDGHFRFIGDLLGKVARFERRIALVSVSMDGVGLPQIYMLDDINKTQSQGQSFKPSVVAQINGMEAVSFMEKEADLGFQQDADTAYNTMFFNPAANFNPSFPFQYGYFGGDQRQGVIWPGANTNITFANGSTANIPTVARVIGNLTGITDGESLYQKFCKGPTVAPINFLSPSSINLTTSPPFTGLPSPSNITVVGYPKPQVVSSDLLVSGYYLNKTEYKDVGVLAIQSFNPGSPQEFQAVVQTMLAEMKRDGKNKLIIDLSINGGGSVLQGFDTFRQLFPTIQDQVMGRFRKQPGLIEMVQSTSDLLPSPLDVNTATYEQLILKTSHYNYLFDQSLGNSHFKSISDKFDGPTFNGDNYSNIFQFDFTDPLLTINGTTGLGMEITGYGNRTNFTQPFPSENIVMLYDGQCASTCTLFSEMMRLQAKVKSISMGGRPSSKQIQAIGGVKGASDNTYHDLFTYTDFMVQATARKYNTSTSSKTPNLAALTDLPSNRSVDNAINMEDQILPGNFNDGIPAQYIYEPADCRIFYTPAMVLSIEKMWEAAADAAFKGKACVFGGISAGMSKRAKVDVNKRRREMIRRERDIPRLRQAATDARLFLAQTRAKKPVERIQGWEGIHGRGVPTFHL